MATKNQINQNNHYVVIMAGGGGTRLWPLSRQDAPKQFQKLVSDKTLIQETYERLSRFLPDERIYVAALESYKDVVFEQLPKLSEERIILEPMGKNTAPSMALIAATLLDRDKDALIATAPSDHVIYNSSAYVKAYQTAFGVMGGIKGKLLAIGIKPDKPHTGLGYIKMGDIIETYEGEKVFVVEEFKEKPDLKTAMEYVKRWQYMWNSACYFWHAADMVKWLEKERPEMMSGIADIITLRKKADGGSAGNRKKALEIYKGFEKVQIEYLLFEKMKDVIVLPADLGWNDVGTWGTLQEMLCNKYDTKIISKGNHIDYGSEEVLVYGNEKLIATIGLDGIMIIDSPDAILVMSKSRADDIGKLLDKMKQENKHSYL